MSGENQVEDPDDEGNEPKKESPGKQMRAQLEQTLAANKDLTTRLALYEAGLGNLTDRQKKAIVREANEEGKEVTGELLKEIANDLGFQAPKQDPKDTKDDSANQNGNQNGNQQQENEDPPDPSVDEDLSYMDAIDRVARRGISSDPDSMEAKIAAAKTQDEVKAIIRAQGQKVGILLEEDVD